MYVLKGLTAESISAFYHQIFDYNFCSTDYNIIIDKKLIKVSQFLDPVLTIVSCSVETRL